MTEAKVKIRSIELTGTFRNAQTAIELEPGSLKLQVSLAEYKPRGHTPPHTPAHSFKLSFALLEPKAYSPNWQKAVNSQTGRPYSQPQMWLPDWFAESGDKFREILKKNPRLNGHLEEINTAVNQTISSAGQKGILTQADLPKEVNLADLIKQFSP